MAQSMTPYEQADVLLDKIKENECQDMCDWLTDLVSEGNKDGFVLVDTGDLRKYNDYHHGDFSIVVNFNGTNMGLDGYYSSFTDCNLSKFYPVRLEVIERYTRDDG